MDSKTFKLRAKTHKQQVQQPVEAGGTPSHSTRKSLQNCCMSLVVIMRQTVVKLFDSFADWTRFMHFYTIFNYILQPTGSSYGRPIRDVRL